MDVALEMTVNWVISTVLPVQCLLAVTLDMRETGVERVNKRKTVGFPPL